MKEKQMQKSTSSPANLSSDAMLAPSGLFWPAKAWGSKVSLTRKSPHLWNITTALMALLLLAGTAASRAQRAQATIYTDNFNVANTTNFDTSSQSGRHSGLLANNVVPQSGGAEPQIQNHLLLLSGLPGSYDTRIHFDPSTNYSGSYRWDWSSGTAGSTITAAGGMVVSFNWIPADSTANWVSYSVGISPNSDTSFRVVQASTDSGILLRNNGGFQAFNQGTLGANVNSGAFPVLATNVVTLYYYFNSWAPGSAVTLSACVNGNHIFTQSFTWTQAGGVQNMELASYAANTRIGNFAVYALSPILGKKGTAGGCQWANLVNASWTYGWGSATPANLAPGVLWYPMWWAFYGGTQAGINASLAQLVTNGAPVLLMYNEPDNASQANMSVASALQGYGLTSVASRLLGFNNLVSPACADDGDTWMWEFMNAMTASNLLCSAVAIHNYDETSSQFLSYVDGIHNDFGYNVYVTEFAPTDWQTPTSITVADCQAYMSNAIPGLKSRSYVLGYSWYAADQPGTGALGTAALFNTNGTLTTLGSQYKSY